MTAWLIVDINVHDTDRYAAYVEQVPALVARHGGTYLVRGGNPETLEGDWDAGRVVVLGFSSREAARAFVDDPDYAPIKAIRHAAADSKMLLVDGADG